MIFLGWRFWGFDDFFMLEVSVEDGDFVWICACLFEENTRKDNIILDYFNFLGKLKNMKNKLPLFFQK